ncbi:cellulose synthase-like protein E6 [Cornus florida]|uniref:cellulose synthase-like protein E6 n=1 Tax=Cornus florida TaxID=4283 RepID=UPI00289C0F4A|nr:cellulose synthase-like protein E6 [Cornus florida]
MGKDSYFPLFETKAAKGRIFHRLYVVPVCISICLICFYRATRLPTQGEVERWTWIGMFVAELWFILYWFITQSIRWSPVYRHTFKDRLSQRYEKVLPGVDIFVCTADPIIEPPIMVINTVLSMAAYDYPPEKLSVYLSDDGGSELTFYALLEASRFLKHWLPYCRKFKIEPPAPAAYFSTVGKPRDGSSMVEEWSSIKKLYEEMKKRIEDATKLGRIADEFRKEHKGFNEWDLPITKRDHHTILQILIDGRDSKAVDIEGQPLPTLAYLAREKRPQYHHNFKAGAMNALIRVSSRISNAPIILNVDCDMYSNNLESVREALCFFMDEEKGHQIAYVQFPQVFDNLTKNDIYGSSLRIIIELEIAGLDANGGPFYIGSGCFHRRDSLSGKKYDKECKAEWKTQIDHTKVEQSADVLEETSKVLASCTYEQNTLWGNEMGLMYGCPVEDVITGLVIKCRGWKPVYFNPRRDGFLGLAPVTLLQSLIQHKRWSEGDFQIFLSKHCPFVYGYRRIPLILQISYCCYMGWAPNCLATLYYVAVPPLCTLRGISLFPKLSSHWALPFACAIVAKYIYSYAEFLWCGGGSQEWWNDQRMWLFKRLTSYLFGFSESILKVLGFTSSGFVVTAKVADEEVSQRYEQELMEFGAPSPMFTIIATLALVNLFSFVGVVKNVIWDLQTQFLDQFALQILLCALLVLINLPVFQGLFFRKDNGRMPNSVVYQSIIVATLAHLVALY